MIAIYRLFRLPLAVVNGISAVGGYLLFPGSVGPLALVSAFLGVALLAAGASALNQVLERDLDRLMVRTMNRPLPTGQLSIRAGVMLGTAAIIAGNAVLAAAGELLPVLLGTASLACYLGLYTPLKRRTPQALLIGGLSGAASPIIGWCVAGGDPAARIIILVAGIMYLWQIPHFWFLQRRHAEDYRRAGIPLLADASTGFTSGLLCLVWTVALFAATMLLPALGMLGGLQTMLLAAFFLALPFISRMRDGAMLFPAFSSLPIILSLLFLLQR